MHLFDIVKITHSSAPPNAIIISSMVRTIFLDVAQKAYEVCLVPVQELDGMAF